MISQKIAKKRKSRFPVAAYRLVGLCVLVGILGGVAALLFDFSVELAQRLLLERFTGYAPPPPGVLEPAAALPKGLSRWWIPLVTTLGGLLSGILVFGLAPETEGHGTDAAIGNYHRQGGFIRNRVPFVKAIASAITIGSGGVAGREGPTAQIAVGLGSMISRRLNLHGEERRIILLASMAGGLAAIFQAPLGMAIFAVEILYAGMVFESEALIYTVIAAVTGYAFHGFFAGWSPVFAIPEGLAFQEPETLIAYAVLGLLAGLVGSVLPTVFYGIRDLFAKLPVPPHFKPAIGGLGVGLIGMGFPEILGTGYGWVELAMSEKLPLTIILVLLLFKGPAMGLTIGSGGSGGVFGPTVVIGAMLGGLTGTIVNQLSPFFQVNVAAFVVVGMAAIFAGAARTPISTLIMVAEMTGGYGLIVPAMLTNVLSFMVQRSVTTHWHYRTLYVSQVPSREDSPAHQGVFVRRALRMVDEGLVDNSDLTLPRLVSLLRFGDPIPVHSGEELLISFHVGTGSALAGKTVAEGIGRVSGTTAVAVLRGNKMVVPRGPTLIEAGDQVIVVATTAAHEELKKLSAAATDNVQLED
ncbi:MAG TPA: chloride channel protein [Acidobacteriota bacterium]|nr:chloride channel protein [Acidobacteriota bacterium]